MLEFNNEHMKANFSKLKKMVLEFNNEHAKASFKKIIDKITLEYNNNHAKANMKDLDLKLRKALLVVSGVGLITVATGCSINQNYNLDQTTLETTIENELFNDNQEIVVGAEKVDVYEQSEVVMDALESVGVLLEEPEQVEELTYEEFKETVEDVENQLQSGEVISYTDQELTEMEQQLMGDYYAIREYTEQNQSQDYQELYNNVLITRIHELFDNEGINSISVTDVVCGDYQTLLKLNIDGEEVILEVGQNSDLAKMMANMEQQDYENFREEINTLINKDMYTVKTSKYDRIVQGDKKVAMLAGGTFLTATIVALMSACAYVDKKKKKENDKTM